MQKCRIQSCLFGFVCTTKSLRATTAQSRAGTSSRDKVARQNRAMNRRCDVGLSRGGRFTQAGEAVLTGYGAVAACLRVQTVM